MSMHKSGRNDNVTPGASCKVTPGFDRIPAVHMPANVPQSDTTLGDYIARKQQQVAFEDVAQEKKLTFDEWYAENRTSATNQLIISGMTFEEWLFFAWKAAQENK